MEKYGKYIVGFLVVITVFVIYKFIINPSFKKEREQYLKILDDRFNGFKKWMNSGATGTWKSEIQRKAVQNGFTYDKQLLLDWIYDLQVLRNYTFADGTVIPGEFLIEYKKINLG